MTGKRIGDDGRYLVDLKLTMINQRDLETALRLGNRRPPVTRGRVSRLYPTVPADLQRKATEMFAR